MSSKLARATLLLICLFTGLSSKCEAQAFPTVKIYAYQRDVVGGIPVGPPGIGASPRQHYVIYLETPSTAKFTVEGVWMNRKYHAVETAIRKTPIRFESPVKLADDTKSVAVPSTTNTVTEIVVKEPLPDKTPDATAARMLEENQAAVQVNYQGKSVLVPVNTFEKRDPLYMR
jgi:hypothetical protein